MEHRVHPSPTRSWPGREQNTKDHEEIYPSFDEQELFLYCDAKLHFIMCTQTLYKVHTVEPFGHLKTIIRQKDKGWKYTLKNCFWTAATSNISLSSPDYTPAAVIAAEQRTAPPPGQLPVPPMTSPYSKLDGLRSWSFNTYKFTRQVKEIYWFDLFASKLFWSNFRFER